MSTIATTERVGLEAGRVRLACACLAGLLLIGAFQTASAQTSGKISGVVTTADTGEPLPGVNVVIEGTTQGTATDAQGRYFIVNVDPGTYDVRASFIGYTPVTQSGVVVTIDHTTQVDFDLRPEQVGLDEIVVEAEPEVVRMDLSASSVSVQGADIDQVPTVRNFEEFLNLQGGIQGMSVRGGGLGEIDFMLDGLTMVDNRANTPMTNMVNLSAIKGAEIIKGGFNAEYGDVRSGVISVVTKDGNPDRYEGTIDVRLAPPRIKHSGEPLYSPMNYNLRPYLDPDVMWEGTDNGTWSEELQEQYPSFIGWNAVSERLMEDDDPANDMTPEQARDKFLWETAAEGSAELGQQENIYGHRWDWRIDAALGGPVPFVSEALGDLTFFVTHKTNKEEFALPVQRPYFTEQNTMVKLTSRVAQGLNVAAEGTFGRINSVVEFPRGIENINDYNKSSESILTSPYVEAGIDHYSLYNPGGMNWANINMSMVGLNVDHMLSNSTFYKVRISRSSVENDVGRHQGLRDTSTVRCFGGQCVDERPWDLDVGTPYSNQAGFNHAGTHGDPHDQSTTETWNMKFDLTSQVDNYNMIKTGFEVNYDRMRTYHMDVREYTSGLTIEDWEAPPIRAGAYVQDKLEWRGLIANLGVRADYYSPNTSWYFVDDPYSQYYSARYTDTFTQEVPESETQAHLKVSPRVGVSHPISSVSKLYFNYGHFYSAASAADRYRLYHPGQRSRLTFLGNPNLDLPRTIAYELGYEHQVGPILVHLAGYYKDVTGQPADVAFTNYDASVDYTTVENNNYADIRGFEVRLEKNAGDWFTGWVNYTYMVHTEGFIGREHYYQDQRLQRLQGLQNPYQEKPLARPYARALVNFHTPSDFGPTAGAVNPFGDWTLSFVYRYRAGNHMTWDPLDTNELQDNVQWRGYHNWDLRISKQVNTAGFGIRFYADVQNLLNQKHLDDIAFEQGSDFENYMRSLRLPMYEGEEYQSEGLTAGNDRPGDIKSSDKPYINMPNREFLWYLDQRFIEFGTVVTF